MATKNKLYILKIALYGRRGTWRRIAILDIQSLSDLHDAIFDAFDRYDEHLYTFYVTDQPEFKLKPQNAYHNAKKYSHPDAISHDGFAALFPSSAQKDATLTTISSLHLFKGQMFLYLFDFGDDWWHEITVEEITTKIPLDRRYPALIAKRGKSPEQYDEIDDDE